MNTFVNTVGGTPERPPRKEPQKYPMTLFGPNWESRAVNTEEQEKALRAQGFTDSPAPRPSVNVEVVQQPRNMAEMVALREQRDKFDAAYAALASQHEALQEEHQALMDANEELKSVNANLSCSTRIPLDFA